MIIEFTILAVILAFGVVFIGMSLARTANTLQRIADAQERIALRPFR